MVINCDSLTVSKNQGWISLSSADTAMVGSTKYIRFGGDGVATQTIACNSAGFHFSASITVSRIGNSSAFMCNLPNKQGTIALTSDIQQTELYEVSFEIENGGFTGVGSSTVAATVYGTFITKIDVLNDYLNDTTGKCTRAELAQILHDSGATSYKSRVFVFSSGGTRAISGMWSSDGTNVRVCTYDGAIPGLDTDGVYAYEANTYIASRAIN